MQILPAIDLIQGQAVRLRQGDYSQVSVYERDPLARAEAFQKEGAEYLHVVDLDGARSGRPENEMTVLRLIRESGLKLEIGGGIRCMETIRRYLEAGADRVILGTAAISDSAFLKESLQLFGAHLAVGVDALGGEIRTAGWQQASGRKLADFLPELAALGAQTLICTDISRDGMMKGTNRALYREIKEQFPQIRLIASGGISSLEDIIALKEGGVDGAIIGKALYTGAIRLSDAIACAGGDI